MTETYELLSVVGSGSFGRICKVKRISDGEIMARKEIDYRKMKDKERRQLVQEVNILRDLVHPHIVKYYSRYVDKQHYCIHILMEYCDGGDLATLIQKHKEAGTHLSEETIWGYLAQLTLALHECHHGYATKKGVVGSILHRDIKPENVFLDADNNIKLGDFGLSTLVQGTSDRCFAQTFVGTPFYMSPELINETAYNTKSDMWALGCLIYELCNLEPPFRGHTHHQLHENIRHGYYPKLNSFYSKALRDVVSKLLQVSPEKRPSAELLLQHPTLVCILREKQFLATYQQKETVLKLKEETLHQHEQRLVQKEQLLQQKEWSLVQKEEALYVKEQELFSKEKELLHKQQELEIRQAKAQSIHKVYQSTHMIDFAFTEPTLKSSPSSSSSSCSSSLSPSSSSSSLLCAPQGLPPRLTFSQWMQTLPSSVYSNLDYYLSQLHLKDGEEEENEEKEKKKDKEKGEHCFIHLIANAQHTVHHPSSLTHALMNRQREKKEKKELEKEKQQQQEEELLQKKEKRPRNEPSCPRSTTQSNSFKFNSNPLPTPSSSTLSFTGMEIGETSVSSYSNNISTTPTTTNNNNNSSAWNLGSTSSNYFLQTYSYPSLSSLRLK